MAVMKMQARALPLLRGGGGLLAVGLLVPTIQGCSTSSTESDLSAGGAGSSPSELSAIPGPNFLRVSGASAVTSLACISQDGARPAFQQILEAVQPDELDPMISLIIAAERTECGAIFYAPVANEISGLGYQHSKGGEFFDHSPDSQLEGIAYLNDLPYWLQEPEEFFTAFLHEVAHRWSGRVHLGSETLPPTVLLGRQLSHWSYFLDTGGSPLEGNVWSQVGDGRFESHTPTSARRFSELDLYLMGVLDPEGVGGQRILIPEASDKKDCFGSSLASDSPPQFCEPLQIEGEAYEFTLDDIISEEGAREPAPTGPRVVDVAIFLLESDAALSPKKCRALQRLIDDAIEAFSVASNGLMTLRNLTESNSACEE